MDGPVFKRRQPTFEPSWRYTLQPPFTPGSEGWWSVGGGWSVRCVQRRTCPRPLHLNLFPTSTTPLINYVLNQYRASDTISNFSIEIDVGFGSLDADDQGVPSCLVESLK